MGKIIDLGFWVCSFKGLGFRDCNFYSAQKKHDINSIANPKKLLKLSY